MFNTGQFQPLKNQFCEELLFNNQFSHENNRDYDYAQIPQGELVRHCREGTDSEDTVPLSDRWSPLGANYDEVITPITGLPSPVSELELLCSESIMKHKELHKEDLFQKYIEEQELLTSSLMALTSHFAHVQLRVRQIVEAPTFQRDQLLKDLDDFAFRGIPEPLSSLSSKCFSSTMLQNDEEMTRQRHFELIEHLKTKLSDVENFVYDSGVPVLPQHVLLEKQKIIIDELKNKLNLKVEDRDLPELSSEELKNQVDNAFGELVGPLKMKEQLVTQLKTQISDLERFIAFLQCDSDDSKMKSLSSNETSTEVYNSYSAKKKTTLANFKKSTADYTAIHSLKKSTVYQGCNDNLNSKALGLVDKASILVQMLATTHFPKNVHFQKNTLKKTSKGNHWGDLRAQLEVDIQEVASLAATLCFDKKKLVSMKKSLKKASITSNEPNSDYSEWERIRNHHSDYNESNCYALFLDSDDEHNCFHWDKNRMRVAHNTKRDDDSIGVISRELNTAVRKKFCVTLQLLIQHGLRADIETATSALIVPFMRCFNLAPIAGASAVRNYRAKHQPSFMTSTTYNSDIDDRVSSGFFGSGRSRQMHAWELILEYYYLKQGDEYNNKPAQKLSQSFNLNMSSNRVSAKQSLLSAIGKIIAMHKPYKRSFNAHFKAFVCESLNSHQLVEWLNLIFSCNDIINTYYAPNSYVACTGFRDSLRSIDSITKYDFDLPVDLAVRHFRNI